MSKPRRYGARKAVTTHLTEKDQDNWGIVEAWLIGRYGKDKIPFNYIMSYALERAAIEILYWIEQDNEPTGG